MAVVTLKAPNSLKDEHEAAKHAVESWLFANCATVTALGLSDVQHIRRGLVGGWRLPLEVAGGTRLVEILIPAAFPFHPARIRLVEKQDEAAWPHREADDVLCLVPETASFDPDDPVGGVANLLNMAIELSRKVASGLADAEFRSEVLSYWNNPISAHLPTIYSLVEPEQVTRLIRVWKGTGSYAIADNGNALTSWLINRHPGLHPDKQDVGALIWIGEALTPSQFPKTAADVWALATKSGADGLLSAAAAAVQGDLLVGLGMNTEHGVAIAGLVIPRPTRRRGHDTVHDGFRNRRTPIWLAAKRYFGTASVIRHRLKRADHSWVHGRDHDANARDLRSKTALVVGCGSVGAPVAISLAQAGIGKLVLVDPDILNASNISRHPLGAQYLGDPKAEALSSKLLQDMPHLIVRPLVGHVEELILTVPDLLSDVDLVVSATGDWGAEVMLDAWHIASARKVPLVYGWTEAHACAGHAVAVVAKGATFRDGFDQTGLPELPVTKWNQNTQFQEPACGAVYQPYGPVELQGTIAVVAELALDAIMGELSSSTHRIWAGRARRLEQAGGSWSSQWLGETGNRSEGGFLFERDWAAPLNPRPFTA